MKRREQKQTDASIQGKGEEKKIRTQLRHMFDKYDFRDRKRFTHFCRWLIFIVLIIIESIMILRQIDDFEIRGGWSTFFWLITISAVLLVAEYLKLFVIKNHRARIVLYVLEALAAGSFSLISSGDATVFIYMLVMTEIYIGIEGVKPTVLAFVTSMLLYIATYLIQNYVLFEAENPLPLLTKMVSSVFSLAVHFVIVQVALAFYHQFLRLDKAMRELDKSKKELEKAYAVVAEVTALEERQRIAKDIHDTAGHSLTTVIMQTESAKLMLESNPEEAKSKIIAANLQAKHALEELRNSVHLLSGRAENQTLKNALEDVVHESTDGTGINIRCMIEDVAVSEAKFRFLCNTLKEGISNGLRHGGATAFWFELKREENKLRFLLSDNGKGVDKKRLELGFGLTSMKDRAKSLGGKVHITSEEGEGFELELLLPIDIEK